MQWIWKQIIKTFVLLQIFEHYSQMLTTPAEKGWIIEQILSSVQKQSCCLVQAMEKCPMFSNILQCFEMCCIVLQCFAMFCNILQCKFKGIRIPQRWYHHVLDTVNTIFYTKYNIFILHCNQPMHSSPKIDSVHWEEIFPASLGKVKVEICSTGRHKTLDIYNIQCKWFHDSQILTRD